jgi:fumarate reductase flavoprotein subunit
MSSISRRELLKSAAIGSTAVAALGVAGVAGADEAAETGKHSWEVKPDPITDVTETVDCDVLIIGGGYSGCSCACNAAQNGLNTILVEKDDVLNGHGVGGTGAIKSRVMDENGIVLDKPIEMERWVATCGNRCSEKIVGKFFRESERCMNWLLDLGEEYGMSCMLTVGSNSTVHPEASCYHMLFGGDFYDQYGYAKAVEYMLADAAEKAGATIAYNTPAVQLVQDDSGAVTGAICTNEAGEYVQYNAAKGVVLATGDVSWNDEYLEEFAPIALQVKSRLCGDLGNVGDGHNMAAWAGAAFQPAPWPTMMHPQAAGMFHGPFLFINPEGKRFMNEATWVQGKCVGIMVNGGSDHAWSIFDSNFEADNTASLEYGGGMFWDSFRAVGTTPADASASHAETVKTGVETTPDYYKCADTLEELVAQLDVPADVALETIAHYNELCEAGEDTDFYKESHFLFPIKEGPFYAVEVGPGLLGVCGGIQINEDFQAVDSEGNAIEGLYAIGNCAGGMYAYDYPINIQGNSHGRCLMEGKCLAEQLAGVTE